MKRAFITGGSRGIGKAIVDVLHVHNIEVIAPTRQEMDLKDPNSIERYCHSVSAPIDIIINNAGVNTIAEIDDLSCAVFDEMLQINLKAPLQIIRCLKEKLRPAVLTHIVNVSSIWGFVSKPGRCGYAAAKSGVIGLTRTLALEFGPRNILVNAVAPGFVNTELTRQNNSPEEIATIAAGIPIGRLAEPDEVAKFVYFLSSDDNTFISGQTILIDGGYTCE